MGLIVYFYNPESTTETCPLLYACVEWKYSIWFFLDFDYEHQRPDNPAVQDVDEDPPATLQRRNTAKHLKFSSQEGRDCVVKLS